jgi:Tfp pilus assembly protein PilF
VDGELLQGRYISPEAYGSYARGSYLQAHGDFHNARAAYVEAIRQDPQSAAAWTQLGAVDCALKQREQAQAAFDRAEKLDAGHAQLWRERARCWLGVGDLDGARRAAERAARHEPGSIETTALLAAIYDRLGLTHEADRWLDGFVTWRPSSTLAWQAALERAARRGDRRRLLAAARQLLALRPERRDELARTLPELGLRRAIDEGLREGRLGFGRSAATRAGISAAELAVRAAALGKFTLAREQAELILAADPGSGDAWVALAVASDDSAELAQQLTRTDRLRRPGALAIRLLALRLLESAGIEAAALWLAAWSPLSEPADELEHELATRLAARFAAAPAPK